MKTIVVVAHPDDEILFFSSLLNQADKVIVCFGPCKDQTVSQGREALQNQYPLSNVEWLNIQESDTFLSANWQNPKITDVGLSVRRNQRQYQQNFNNLVKTLKSTLLGCDQVYTHNPWGEYGHEEHISVFKAVCSAIKGTDTKVYVSSYISDRSTPLFNAQKYLLKSPIITAKIPQKLCKQIKDLYITTECWTWDEHYEWPQSEIFIEATPSASLAENQASICTANPPVMMLTSSFKRSFLTALLARILPQDVKNSIKKMLGK